MKRDEDYVVVWNGRGDRPYLSCDPEPVRVIAPPLPSRRSELRDMQGIVLSALRASTDPLSARSLALLTGFGIKTCRVIMSRAVKRGVAVRAGRRQEITRHYQQTWLAV